MRTHCEKQLVSDPCQNTFLLCSGVIFCKSSNFVPFLSNKTKRFSICVCLPWPNLRSPPPQPNPNKKKQKKTKQISLRSQKRPVTRPINPSQENVFRSPNPISPPSSSQATPRNDNTHTHKAKHINNLAEERNHPEDKKGKSPAPERPYTPTYGRSSRQRFLFVLFQASRSSFHNSAGRISGTE